MARFDCYRVGGTYVVDCQADTLSHLTTRIVAPLLPQDHVPPSLGKLHPVLTVDGETLVLTTHLLSAMPARQLGAPHISLRNEHDRIMAALDMLLTGI